MQDDLRQLVENDLPILAYQIISSGPRRMDGRHNFGNRPNRFNEGFGQVDWSGAHATGRFDYHGVWNINGQEAYKYGLPKRHKDGVCSISFYGIRLTDIEDIDPQPVEVLNPNDVKIVSVDSTENNGPGFISYAIDRTERHDRSSEHTFEAAAEFEYERSVTRKGGGEFGGIEASAEMTDRFKAVLATKTFNEWRQSDSLEQSIRREYEVYPFHQLDVMVQEGMPKLRQKIPTTGRLECGIDIDIRDCNHQRFDTYDDLVKVWRGLKSGSEFYSNFFSGGHAVSEEEMAQWQRPKITLNLEVNGDRVRYSKTQYLHKPIPGKEEEAAKYVAMRLENPKT